MRVGCGPEQAQSIGSMADAVARKGVGFGARLLGLPRTWPNTILPADHSRTPLKPHPPAITIPESGWHPGPYLYYG